MFNPYIFSVVLAVLLVSLGLFFYMIKMSRPKKNILKRCDYIYYMLLSLCLFWLSPTVDNSPSPASLLCEDREVDLLVDSTKVDWCLSVVSLSNKLRDDKAGVFNIYDIKKITQFFQAAKCTDVVSVREIYNNFKGNELLYSSYRRLMFDDDLIFYDSVVDIASRIGSICDKIRPKLYYSAKILNGISLGDTILWAVFSVLLAYKVVFLTAEIRGWLK